MCGSPPNVCLILGGKTSHYTLTSGRGLHCSAVQLCVLARDIFNILLGAILGGSALTAVGPALADPGHIYITIGEALSKSSNFFINYITVQARAAERLAPPRAQLCISNCISVPTSFAEGPAQTEHSFIDTCGAARAAAVSDRREMCCRVS